MITRAQTKLIRKLRSRKRRDQEEAFLVEGIRLVEELLVSSLDVSLLITTPGLAKSERGGRLYEAIVTGEWSRAEVSDTELRRLADTETPQGVLAVVRKPIRRLADFRPGPDAAVLIFDGLGDPGNLGTLARAADALGVAWAVALPGTVDPWNPKAVRAAAGSLFRLPVSVEAWPDVLTWLRERGFAILCADAAGDPVPRGSSPYRRFALVLGSEPAGSSDQVLRDCDRRVAVESRGEIDSLNVAIAGALLLDRLLTKPAAP